MHKLLLSLFVALSVVQCSDAKAQPAEGQDYYAIQQQNWNVPATVKYSTGARALGSLHHTFGDNLAPIRSVLDASHPLFYRVHIINTVCVRDNNCGTYELGHGYTKSTFDAAVGAGKASILNPFKAQVGQYCTLFTAYPSTKLVVSPALEHDLSKKSWRVLADAALSVCPGVLLSNSPDGGVSVERYRGAYIERHGSNPQSDADVVSLDGADATQIDIGVFLAIARKLPNIKIIFLWTAGYNCRVAVWQDPRTRKNCSSGKTIELMNHLFEAVPAAPKFSGTQCKKITPFKAPDIWKPLAESQINYDPRQELPVLIGRGFIKGVVTALSSNGTKEGSLGFYGTYLDQGFRWYSGYIGGSKASGYDLQHGAENDSGSGAVWLQQGSNCKGPLYPDRRQGLMRDN